MQRRPDPGTNSIACVPVRRSTAWPQSVPVAALPTPAPGNLRAAAEQYKAAKKPILVSFCAPELVVSLIVSTLLLPACSSVGFHRPPPASKRNAADLSFEFVSPPQFDRTASESGQSFSAVFFNSGDCMAAARITSMSREGDGFKWQSRDADPPSGGAIDRNANLEFHAKPFRATRIKAGNTTRLALVGVRSFTAYLGTQTKITTRSCRTVIEFIPEAGASYSAKFAWLTGSCVGTVSQTTSTGPATPAAQTLVCKEYPGR